MTPMLATPAQIEATGQISPASHGSAPETGKTRSRADSLKNGLAGVSVVLPARDAAEVERLAGSFRAELKPVGDVGDVLVRRMAVHAVRMDRAVVQEAAALTARVREATDAFRNAFWGDGDYRKLLAEAGNRALFDDSKEGILARKYEAASERAFHRALKELRRMRAESERAFVEAATAPATVEGTPAEGSAPSEKLGSFFPAEPSSETAAPEPMPAPAMQRALALISASLGWDAGLDAHFDIPVAIGRPR
jgi:hypothetical protein